MYQAGRTIKSVVVLSVLLLIPPLDGYPFGFAAHRRINRMAVFTLPAEMIGFFKYHLDYLSERAIDPDRRSHVIKGEAQRHYIDLEILGENPFSLFPLKWERAVELYSEDTLQVHGILPWHTEMMMFRLTQAFRDQNIDKIIYNATHLGHYLSDLCTPLHTTKYYNGREAHQRGIHSLWETRLIEVLHHSFSYLTGPASYVDSTRERIWELLKISHQAVDTILAAYDSLYKALPSDHIFAHEIRGNSINKTYSNYFCIHFHQALNCMAERQMRLAIKSTGDFWYTAWVNAGQPDLYKLEKKALSRAHRKELQREERIFLPLETIPDRL
jgi:hypothetical protein